MRQFMRSTSIMLATGVFAVSTACTAERETDPSPREGGQAAGACAPRFTYEGRTYQKVANVEFTATKNLGFATESSCVDSGTALTPPAPAKMSAYSINGVSPSVAVAIGESKSDAELFAVFSGTGPPVEIQRLAD